MNRVLKGNDVAHTRSIYMADESSISFVLEANQSKQTDMAQKIACIGLACDR